jgi:hypothetical protein
VPARHKPCPSTRRRRVSSVAASVSEWDGQQDAVKKAKVQSHVDFGNTTLRRPPLAAPPEMVCAVAVLASKYRRWRHLSTMCPFPPSRANLPPACVIAQHRRSVIPSRSPLLPWAVAPGGLGFPGSPAAGIHETEGLASCDSPPEREGVCHLGARRPDSVCLVW